MRARLALVVISALLLGAAFPPVGLSHLSWIALVPLFWALESQAEAECGRGGFKRVKRPFLLGLLFGFIFFLATVYWVVYSMYVYGGVPFALALLFMLLLVLILALYPAIFALLFALTSGGATILRLFLVPSAWVGLEYLRATLFTGFPWALTGYTQARVLPVIQIADIFGVYGISFLVVLVNFAIYAYIFNKKDACNEGIFGNGRLAKRAAVLAALVLLTSTLAYGFMKIKVVDARLSGLDETRKGGVAQGNIDQSVKWSAEFRLEDSRYIQGA